MTQRKINFSALKKGVRATRPISFRIYDQDIDVAVRPLLAAEEGQALAWGRSYAVDRGVKEPKDSDRLYEIGVMAAFVATGCVLGADQPETPFFDGGPEQVIQHLDTDRIAYLYEAQQLWQDECSPRVTRIDGDDYIAYVLACAGAAEGQDPLAMLRPVTRVSFIRTLALQHLSSLPRRSASGSDGSSDTTTTPSAPEQPSPGAIEP